MTVWYVARGAGLSALVLLSISWIALGTLAVYTFVLVAAIGFARGRMATSKRGAAAWRWLHSLAYVGWGMAMLHGLNSGTDTSVHWVRLLYLACGIAVIGSVAVRVLREPGLDEAPATVPSRRSASSVKAGAR